MSETLDLVWTAKFEDGHLLRQYEDNAQTIEHPFREVLEHKSRLVLFQLANVHTGKTYQVDLTHGRFQIFGNRMCVPPEAEVQGDSAQNYRLVYFRRVTRTMGSGGSEVPAPDIQYFLGYQYTTAEGKNVKHMIQITKDDELYFT
jgi:hypothetical protein